MLKLYPRVLRPPQTLSPLLRLSFNYFYSTSAEAATPPLLAKFKTDLKTALRSKDTARLNVLRALLADITNASKTSSPIKSDMQVVSLIRKRVSAAQDAATGFKSAGREDLVKKEEDQKMVLEEYMGGVETVGEEEMRHAVERSVREMMPEGEAEGTGESKLKVDRGKLLRQLIGPGGVFEGKNVDKTVVVRMVQEVVEKGKK